MILLDIYAYVKLDHSVDKFLYRLLSQRKPYQNISHKEMPTYEGHVHFIKSRPYKQWYVCVVKNNLVGSIYLTKLDEIGIFLDENWIGMGYGSNILLMLYAMNPSIQVFKANISPLNSHSIAFFANKGFKYEGQQLNTEKDKIIQYIYLKINPYFNEKLSVPRQITKLL